VFSDTKWLRHQHEREIEIMNQNTARWWKSLCEKISRKSDRRVRKNVRLAANVADIQMLEPRAMMSGITAALPGGCSSSTEATAAQTAVHHQQSVQTTAPNIDHPAADVAYTPVSGSLFGANGPKYTDVHQWEVGDCWLVSSLAAVAARYPGEITSMFTAAGQAVENGHTVNLYKVRFFDGHDHAQYVTVDTELPDGGRHYDQTFGGPLWVALAEKAYAEANGKGYVTTLNVGSDSYAALNGGRPSWALQAITGQHQNDFAVNPTDMAAAWKSGKIICLGSDFSTSIDPIVGGHAYAVVGYNASSSTPFEMYNPWGVTAAINAKVNFGGHSFYGGTFYASASLVSHAFSDEFFSGQPMVNNGTGADDSQVAFVDPVISANQKHVHH
jgi:hypothetical protein